MASTHLFPLSHSLVAVLIAATFLFAAVHPAAICSTTTGPRVSGPFLRPSCAPLYAGPPAPIPAIELPGALLLRSGGGLNRRAQWNPNASWPGHNNNDDGGDETYCGTVTKLFLTAEVGPLASDCEAIRAWAADDANRGYFHATMERLNAAPWVRLVTAGSCAVAVGTDYHEAYRNGLLVGTADLAAALGAALGDYAGAGDRLAWQGAWTECASPAYRGAGLDAWPALFCITRSENVA